VIREAMRKKNVVGLARVVLYRRERILMLEPRGDGIVGTTLHYANEVREADTYFDDVPNVKISPDMMDLAEHILQRKHQRFQPEKFEDRYEEALKKLIKAKRAGKELPPPPEPDRSNVIDLMEALRQSVKSERGGKRKASAKRASTRRKTSARSATSGRTTSRRKLKKAS
jgi:DNA end-binding protein Ku